MEARARTTDPATSHYAAASVTNLTEKQAAVLATFRRCFSEGRDLTDSDLEVAYEADFFRRGAPMQSVSGLRTRRKELVDRGLVADTGKRRLTPSGRGTIVWTYVPQEDDGQTRLAL